jgi:hypothetical protein
MGLDSALIPILSVGILVGGLLFWLWRHQPKPSLPADAALVYTKGIPGEVRSGLIGSLMLVGIGTFGANQILRLLELLHLCRLDALVGSVLCIENDSQLRQQFMEHVPKVFHARIVLGYSEAYAGGMVNSSPDRVVKHIGMWGRPIASAAYAAIDKQRRGTAGVPGRPPGNILMFLSLGGQAAVGLPALDVLYEQFSEVMMLGFVALPIHKRLRQHFALLKSEYERRGVYGWMAADSLCSDPTTADYGMVALIVGMADAALYADRATQPNNAFSLALGHQPGRIMIYQVVSDNVVAYPVMSGSAEPPSYSVSKRSATETVIKALARVEQGKGLLSAALPVEEHDVSTFDVVMVSVGHDATREIADEVHAGYELEMAYHARSQPAGAQSLIRANYGRLFASIATVVDPLKPVCPVVVVRIATVRSGADLGTEIAKLPGERYAASPQVAPPAVPVVSANGF